MTKNGAPRSVVPASRTFAMLGVVHQRQRLPLRLEPRQHRPRVAAADQLDGHGASDGFGLLGHPDAAHAALADAFEQLVLAG
jgi:hypothetical protein